jgi:hypothetical protein
MKKKLCLSTLLVMFATLQTSFAAIKPLQGKAGNDLVTPCTTSLLESKTGEMLITQNSAKKAHSIRLGKSADVMNILTQESKSSTTWKTMQGETVTAEANTVDGVRAAKFEIQKDATSTTFVWLTLHNNEISSAVTGVRASGAELRRMNSCVTKVKSL